MSNNESGVLEELIESSGKLIFHSPVSPEKVKTMADSQTDYGRNCLLPVHSLIKVSQNAKHVSENK